MIDFQASTLPEINAWQNSSPVASTNQLLRPLIILIALIAKTIALVQTFIEPTESKTAKVEAVNDGSDEDNQSCSLKSQKVIFDECPGEFHENSAELKNSNLSY